MTSDQVTTDSPLRANPSFPRWVVLSAAGLLCLLLIAACAQNTESALSPDRPPSGELQSPQPAGFGQTLPPAKDLEELGRPPAQEVQPVSITIERLGLNRTPILSVGTESNGEMEVPPPKDVGWYRYGPRPGEAGSAVLAGHVASGGVDGAFRFLDRLQPGDLIVVEFDTGGTTTFMVKDKIQVDKTSLPFDQLFARNGAPQIALITCGGEFNYEERSYQDNIVVTADLVG
ncbi:MAG: class F sortase [Acidimicrobiia bacterium]|nr:class F sortase [Acidimicrobiia bacterium]